MKLIKPDRKYYNSFLEAVKEYTENNVTTYQFFECDTEDIFIRMQELEDGINLPKGWVTGTYLWMVDGDEFVGEVNIRHKLTEDLLKLGGHIGYGVRYSRQNEGIGTKMLSLALTYAKNELGLDKVLLTCNDDNYASIKVIENNNGVLQDKIHNTIDNYTWTTRRYWIDL